MEQGMAIRTSGIPTAPIGVIDIGSNSVRMVVYEGARRAPHTLFNEKVLCGLGSDLAETGRLSKSGIECARAALLRFSHLAADMNLAHLEVVATSAVRDAADGGDFVASIKSLTGFDMRVLSGEEEADYAALGVLSGTPDADGVVGDLGGGSLELVRVAGGEIFERVTLPIGPVRLLGDSKLSPQQRTAKIRESLKSVKWLADCKGKPLYLVGGAWRALARLEMQRTRFPIPIVHHYVLSQQAIENALTWTKALLKKEARKGLSVPDRRVPTLPLASEILRRTMLASGASEAIISAMGLREGLLYERLSPIMRAKDPFIDACEEMAQRQSRFPEHGDILMRWLDALFGVGESKDDNRIRRGICLTSDVGWRAHPDYRAESAMYESLYGWFVGVDARARAMMGLALFICYGASPSHANAKPALALLNEDDKKRAIAIGQALRLAQRLSGGTAGPLANSRLEMDAGQLTLRITKPYAPLLGEVVVRRLSNVASALGVPHDIRVVANL